MKTRTQQKMAWFLVIGTLLLSFVSFDTSHAEMSDREFENNLHEERRDFEKFLKSRASANDAQAKAAEALRESRAKEERTRLEVLAEYTRKMKRYSMEEVEARDRADEERVAKEEGRNDGVRSKFVDARNHRREIKARTGTIDTYRELDINMNQEPESKVSHTGTSSTSSDNF